MSQLVIPDVDDALLSRLKERAARHGRSLEREAKTILAEALPESNPWAAADKVFAELSATGRTFSDSAELIREDRER